MTVTDTFDSPILFALSVHPKHTPGAELLFCEWSTHFPTTGSELSLSISTKKSMVWLPVANFEHHEERGSVYASVTSFHEKLYVLADPATGVVSLRA
jgi:hypothetical protein